MTAQSAELRAQRFVVAFVAALALFGCSKETRAPRPPFPTVATVNGVVLTQADLDAALQASGGHGPKIEPTAEQRQKALETLIHDELVRQRALELGLSPNPQHLGELARLEARLVQAQRRALSDAFFTQEVEGRVEVSEAEARQLFEENAPRLRTELKLNQLLFRDAEKAEQAVAELERGEGFEAVARRQFPELPAAAGKPWELDFLSWRQMPAQWRPIIFGLASGQSTGVVRGPNNRFWVLQVIARRENPALTFEDLRADLLIEIKTTKLAARAAELDKTLRARARITVEQPAPTLAHVP
jgi:peptidyl-prolyl cis-trans isomerase C